MGMGEAAGLAMSRVRFGYLRLTVALKREGWEMGKQLIQQLYTELGLQMRPGSAGGWPARNAGR
jgi:hypothetical protein